jgi:PAS domain-containing protein
MEYGMKEGLRGSRPAATGQGSPVIDAIAAMGARRLLADLMLVLCANPGKACAQSRVMLARVRPAGIFELLTAAAWARALGYSPDELSGRSLRELMGLEHRAAGEIVAALLDRDDARPLDVALRCKDERRKFFRFHRRFDAYEEVMFVVADELAGDRPAPLRACG